MAGQALGRIEMAFAKARRVAVEPESAAPWVVTAVALAPAVAAVLLASRGATAAYVSPGGAGPTAEPVRLWLQYFGPGQSPIDPVRLYVGNVAGPVFATSMLAVAVGAAWLWYSRRLSLLVVLTFLLGALLPIRLMGWAPGYQLDSGPLWFAAALVLADRRTLVTSGVGR